MLNGMATFVFEDGRSELRGRWENDVMIGARFFFDGKRRFREVEYVAEVEFPPAQPLLEDPYEAMYVTVAPSTLPDAGEVSSAGAHCVVPDNHAGIVCQTRYARRFSRLLLQWMLRGSRCG